MRYLLYENWGGKVYDIKKSISNPDDDLMCWAAAASNVLAWTGWGFPTQELFPDENAIFSYFLAHWTESSGYINTSLEWWFNGQNQTGVTTPGGGFWDPPYAFKSYFKSEYDRTKVLDFIRDGVVQGYGMALNLISQQGGHYMTCWGYELAEDGTYLGIYTTDSDDPEAGPQYYPVRQDHSGNEWAHGLDYWYFTYKGGTYLIGEVHALERNKIPQAPTGLRVVQVDSK